MVPFLAAGSFESPYVAEWRHQLVTSTRVTLGGNDTLTILLLGIIVANGNARAFQLYI